MNLRASATFKPGNFAAFEALIVPRLVKAATTAATAVLTISQGLVPVDTGELKASGKVSVEWVGQKVTGYVTFTKSYAAFVEYGTGRRGAASPGAGPWEYKENWPGMRAQPYLRPAMDIGRSQIVTAFQQALGV